MITFSGLFSLVKFALGIGWWSQPWQERWSSVCGPASTSGTPGQGNDAYVL